MTRVDRTEAVDTPGSSLQQIGATLREAREAKGLNVEDVAARLRLSGRTVRILEEGAFERLPAATYARGYVRAYANFVGLAADSLLMAYDQRADQPPQINPYASAPHRQIRASDLPVRAVTYTVVAVLVGLLGIWLWQTQKVGSLASLSVPKWGAEDSASGRLTERVALPTAEGNVDTIGSVGTSAANATAPQSALGYTYPVVGETSAPAPLAPDAAASTNGAGSVVNPAAAVTGAVPTDVAGQVTSQSSTRLPQDGATEPSLNTANAGGATAATTLPVTSPSGNHVLMFELAADAWVEVTDAEAKRLYYNLGKQGSRISVQGVLPYTVKVGNADAVQVSYEGRRLDIAAFSNNAVAIFKVTPDGFLAEP
jgi:cytoskeleton protein RodZ